MLDDLLTLMAHTYRRWPELERNLIDGKKAETASSEKAHALSLRFYPGQVVRAQVMESGSDWARVRVDGQPLLASLKTPLPAGRTVWLMVERLAPVVHFRLLSEVVSSEEESRLLRALKLPVTDKLVHAVRYLSDHRLPFDARMLRQLHQWQHGTYLNEQGLQAAVELQARGFPLRFPLFYAVYQALTDHRGQQRILANHPALAEWWSSLHHRFDTKNFRLDLAWKSMVSILANRGQSAGAEESPKEGSVVLLGHTILQFPVAYGDAWSIYSFPLPPWLPMSGWLQLAVPKERRQGWPPAGHLRMLLRMPRLQDTEIRLYWQENSLFLTILTDQPVPAGLRRAEEDRLRKALEKLGFIVRSVNWHQMEMANTAAHWFSEGVDVRC